MLQNTNCLKSEVDVSDEGRADSSVANDEEIV